jgi:hypothetical protein
MLCYSTTDHAMPPTLQAGGILFLTQGDARGSMQWDAPIP